MRQLWCVVALVAGCDGVFRLTAVPADRDAGAPTPLECAGTSALLCADFEEGDLYYVNGIQGALLPSSGAVTAAVEGDASGHALHIESAGGTYSVQTRSTSSQSAITATFDIELAQVDTTTPVTTFMVLSIGDECYVNLVYAPAPVELDLGVHCGSPQFPTLAMPIPPTGQLVSVTFQLDLGAMKTSASIGNSNQMASATLDPPNTSPAAAEVCFGVVNSDGPSNVHVVFDNILVMTGP